MSAKKNKSTSLESLGFSEKAWLEVQFAKPVSNEWILNELHKHFKYLADYPLKEIEIYRRSIVPDYETLLPKNDSELPPFEKIEEEVKEEIAKVKDEEIFSRDETKKLNLLKSHRMVLRETWDNYLSIKNGDDENSKKNYLTLTELILEKIEKQEMAEASFFSAIEEVRKAESQMTISQHFDSMISWGIPRMAEKGKDQHEILEYLFKLQVFLNYYTKIIMESTSVSEANLRLLEELYAEREVTEKNAT